MAAPGQNASCGSAKESQSVYYRETAFGGVQVRVKPSVGRKVVYVGTFADVDAAQQAATEALQGIPVTAARALRDRGDLPKYVHVARRSRYAFEVRINLPASLRSPERQRRVFVGGFDTVAEAVEARDRACARWRVEVPRDAGAEPSPFAEPPSPSCDMDSWLHATDPWELL